MPLTAKEMIRLLEKNGFKQIRQKGSHVFMQNPQNGRVTTVPYHSGDLKPGTEKQILKDAGIK